MFFAGGSAHADVFGIGQRMGRRFLVQSESQKMRWSVSMLGKITLSLGVCNGCQFDDASGIGHFMQCRILTQNDAATIPENLNAAFVNVEVEESPSNLFKRIGRKPLWDRWIAHGEASFHFPKRHLGKGLNIIG